MSSLSRIIQRRFPAFFESIMSKQADYLMVQCFDQCQKNPAAAYRLLEIIPMKYITASGVSDLLQHLVSYDSARNATESQFELFSLVASRCSAEVISPGVASALLDLVTSGSDGAAVCAIQSLTLMMSLWEGDLAFAGLVAGALIARKDLIHLSPMSFHVVLERFSAELDNFEAQMSSSNDPGDIPMLICLYLRSPIRFPRLSELGQRIATFDPASQQDWSFKFATCFATATRDLPADKAFAPAASVALNAIARSCIQNGSPSNSHPRDTVDILRPLIRHLHQFGEADQQTLLDICIYGHQQSGSAPILFILSALGCKTNNDRIRAAASSAVAAALAQLESQIGATALIDSNATQLTHWLNWYELLLLPFGANNSTWFERDVSPLIGMGLSSSSQPLSSAIFSLLLTLRGFIPPSEVAKLATALSSPSCTLWQSPPALAAALSLLS
jgi:hypothetical protein